MHIIDSDFTAIARHRENFNIRDAQLDISKNIYESISNTTKTPTLIVEAGTGIGKSLSYLVPIIRAGKRAIISTNTKGLQKQLAEELADLQKLYPTVSFKVLQGASNYACLLKAELLTKYPKISNWIKQQKQNKLPGMADSFEKGKNKLLWAEIATDSKLCQEKCRFFDQCFYQSAKTDSRTAQIVILNHDLLLLYFKINSEIFEKAEVVVIDEAHHFPEKARQALSYSLTNKGLSKHIESLNWKMQYIFGLDYQFNDDKYAELEEELFSCIPSDEEKIIRLKTFDQDMQNTAREILRLLEEDKDFLLKMAKEDDCYNGDAKRLIELIKEIGIIFLEEKNDWIKVYSVKMIDQTKIQKMEAIPLNVGSLLLPFFQEKFSVATSATLRDGNDFGFFKNQIGQPGATEICHPSPFDKKNVSVFIPKEPIDPIQPAYYENLTDYMVEIHEKMHGRSLFLFTNREDQEECRRRLPTELKDRFYFQTQTAEIPNMIKTLRTTQNVSLVGLSGLWEGIDVVGDALSCVCIMRMPFANPDDVIVSALKEKYRNEHGGRDFGFFDERDLPEMLLKMKQGFGRLVRHENDTGLLALLDNRFMRKKYRDRVIELLEGYECYDDLDEAIKNIPRLSFGKFSKIGALTK